LLSHRDKKQKLELELIGIVKPKAIMKQWAKWEEQIERVMGATVGMYGDLQGIAGKSLQEIAGLELSMLSAPTAEAEGSNEK
jgi:hypothetical protein